MHRARELLIAISITAGVPACAGAHATMSPHSTPPAVAISHDPGSGEVVARRPDASAQSTAIAVPVSAPADASVAAVLTVAIDASGSLLLDGQPITEAALAVEIRSRVAVAPQLRGVLAADRRVTYGRVIEVIDLMRREGVTRFAMAVTAP
ncbi:MAG: biopolymer transporter ExbD [Deltaproteobacteria bacterium]